MLTSLEYIAPTIFTLLLGYSCFCSGALNSILSLGLIDKERNDNSNVDYDAYNECDEKTLVMLPLLREELNRNGVHCFLIVHNFSLCPLGVI